MVEGWVKVISRATCVIAMGDMQSHVTPNEGSYQKKFNKQGNRTKTVAKSVWPSNESQVHIISADLQIVLLVLCDCVHFPVFVFSNTRRCF